MRAVSKSLVNLLKKEDGPTAVEYAVMLALIIVVCIAAITTLGTNANSTFNPASSLAAVRGPDPGRGGGGLPPARTEARTPEAARLLTRPACDPGYLTPRETPG